MEYLPFGAFWLEEKNTHIVWRDRWVVLHEYI